MLEKSLTILLSCVAIVIKKENLSTSAKCLDFGLQNGLLKDNMDHSLIQKTLGGQKKHLGSLDP